MIDVDHVEPPADPEEWTDEQWIEWLTSTDVTGEEPEESISAVVNRVVRSAPGQVLGQAMIGMAKAIYGRPDDDVVVVVKGAGELAEDEPFAVRLDPEHPERSTITFRPGSHSPD